MIPNNTSPTPALFGRPDGLFTLAGDSPPDLLAELSRLNRIANDTPSRVAHKWWLSLRGRPTGRLGLAFVAEPSDELRTLLDLAESHLRNRPTVPIADRIFYSPNPLNGEVAFVYPGSGNHFSGMGRELGAAFPHVLHRQMAESQFLASQYHANEVWRSETLDHLTPCELLFAQVALGTLVSDLLVSFGVKPNAVVPYSLGESAGLYGTRAWRDRDEMFRRINESPLFESDLAGPCDAARKRWKLPAVEQVNWVTGTIAASAERVQRVIPPGARAYLLIINTADDCVIGGDRATVESLVRELGVSFHEVRGVSTAHCEVVEPVKEAYREFHLLPTYPPEGVRYYSGAWGRAYALSERSAADAITAAALGTIDFPRVVNAAYADGARIFIEIGPGSSCTRMIGSILQGRPHLARAACVPRQDSVGVILRLLANLHAEGVPLDLSILYGQEQAVPTKTSGPTITLPVGYHPKRVVLPRKIAEPVPDVIVPSVLSQDSRVVNPVAIMAGVETANIAAHDAYLRFSSALQTQFAQVIAGQTLLMQQVRDSGESVMPIQIETKRQPRGDDVPRSLDFAECMEFARGKVGDVLGPRFAAIDDFPTRVRLPDGPLQLVDRVVAMEGEPLSLTPGSVVTEHLVHEKRWYLENGRIPGCVAIEAGQADLFLSGFLGIDFKTRGLACYRLLDAAVTFHRELPRVGELIRYDIHIDNFFRQGDTHLFRFRFDGTINGEPLLTMRGGCAGFFTTQELSAGKGVVHTALDLKPMPGIVPAGWKSHVPLGDESLSDEQVESLRSGNLVGAFGPAFSRASLKSPMRLPGGMLKLVHRVERIEPTGGRYGLGRIRCESDIHPDDWFLTCHFVDDQVMPGTLMYECCLHTLRVLLMRMGWVAEEGEARFEPVPGVASKLKCRGQVIATTKKVIYEVSLKEIGFRPEPYVICDALMYADGKPIVDITNMSLRLSGMTRERLDQIWNVGQVSNLPETRQVGNLPHKAVFTSEQVLEFATGSPSKAYGDRYRPFDDGRFIARLPAPPYSFIDRVTRVQNCEPWKLAPGASAEVEYAVPPDAWYFASNRCDRMPYSVLNEIALQACGWMAAYLGSALTSPDDMHFRNLGGNATQHLAVRPDSGLLTTSIKLKQVSPAAGMIILGFDFKVEGREGVIYSGDTTFGFFTKASLANQVGLKDAKLISVPAQPRLVSKDAPFPDAMLSMVDTISHCSPTMVEGRARVNPEAWFFKAHFFQDPVWPGSLGLESLVQLLKVNAFDRWGAPPTGWQAMALGVPHKWAYRGQIVPSATEVTVQAYITDVEDARRFLKADGLLCVDGRIIYQMKDFTLQG